MTTTTYYDLNIVEGTDIVNPLTVDNPNYEKIDEAMHENAVSGVTLATEIANATVHAITRENSECSVIRFIATSVWKAGDTVTVDGVPVTALLPSGETLPDGAYVINANVLCILTGTNLTVYVERKKINDASDIKYNDTNVAVALTSLNSELNKPFSTANLTSDYLSVIHGGYIQIGKMVFVSIDALVTKTWEHGSFSLQILKGFPVSCCDFVDVTFLPYSNDSDISDCYFNGGAINIHAGDTTHQTTPVGSKMNFTVFYITN